MMRLQGRRVEYPQPPDPGKRGDMEGQHTPEAQGAVVPMEGARPRRQRSKMFDAYLMDIEQLMRERLWDEAVPLALGLPHICVALADPGLRSSRAEYLQWCEAWVRPPHADTGLAAPSPATLLGLANGDARSDTGPSAEVPLDALRRLRLRRLSRTAPLRRRDGLTALLRQEAARQPERAACFALLDAAQRWYAEFAARNAGVQGNLGRLAVLR